MNQNNKAEFLKAIGFHSQRLRLKVIQSKTIRILLFTGFFMKPMIYNTVKT